MTEVAVGLATASVRAVEEGRRLLTPLERWVHRPGPFLSLSPLGGFHQEPELCWAGTLTPAEREGMPRDPIVVKACREIECRIGRPISHDIHNNVTVQWGSLVKDAVSISSRATEVAERLGPGGWEGELFPD